MPKSDKTTRKMETIPLDERVKHIADWQRGWYEYLGRRFRGKSIIDVGGAHGLGIDVFTLAGCPVVAIDPGALRGDVLRTPVEEIPDKSFDIAVACDVIEHVDDDAAFLRQLERVASEFVFLSAPNWNYSYCTNEFHMREYTPEEMLALLGARKYEILTSPSGRHNPIPISDMKLAYNCFGILIKVKND